MLRLLTLGLLAMLATAPTSAAEPQPSTTSPQLTTPDGSASPAPSSPFLALTAAMMEEIQARMQSHQELETELGTRALAASGEEQDVIQRQVQDATAQLMVDVLQIQLKYARLEGRDALVQQLETNIARLVEVRSNPTAELVADKGSSLRRPSRSVPEGSALPSVDASSQGLGTGGGER